MTKIGSGTLGCRRNNKMSKTQTCLTSISIPKIVTNIISLILTRDLDRPQAEQNSTHLEAVALLAQDLPQSQSWCSSPNQNNPESQPAKQAQMPINTFKDMLMDSIPFLWLLGECPLHWSSGLQLDNGRLNKGVNENKRSQDIFGGSIISTINEEQCIWGWNRIKSLLAGWNASLVPCSEPVSW